MTIAAAPAYTETTKIASDGATTDPQSEAQSHGDAPTTAPAGESAPAVPVRVTSLSFGLLHSLTRGFTRLTSFLCSLLRGWCTDDVVATVRAICGGYEFRLSCLKGGLCMLQTLESTLRRRLSEDAVGADTKGMDTKGADPAGTFSCTVFCTAGLWCDKNDDTSQGSLATPRALSENPCSCWLGTIQDFTFNTY